LAQNTAPFLNLLSEQETIFQKFFPGREYEIESGKDSDKVFSPGFEVQHNRKSQTLLTTRPGDQYGRRYLLNLKGDEIDVLAGWIIHEIQITKTSNQ